jgi:O-antigen/teichoic acid export membrane protein
VTASDLRETQNEGPGAAVEGPEAGVLRNSSWALISQVMGGAVTAGVTILAVRTVSVSAWGNYATALALIAIATVFASSGITTLALREMSDDVERQNSILGTCLAAIGAVAVVTAIATVPIAVAFGYSRAVIALVLLALPLIYLQPALSLLQVSLNARHALYLAARFSILQSVVFGLGAVLALRLGLGAPGLVVATVIAAMVGAVAALVLLRKHFAVWPNAKTVRRDAVSYLRAATPLAGIGIATILYGHVDILMLSLLDGADAVARYSVAYNVIVLTAVIPSVVAAAFFPVLNRAVRQGGVDEASAPFFFTVRVFLLISVPLAIVLAVSAPVVLPLVFGSRYESSVDLLQILAATPVATFQIYASWYVIFAARRERPILAFQTVGLLFNVVLNALLIPPFGPAGAAWSWLAAETLVAALQISLVHRYLFPIPYRQLFARPALAALVVAPVAVLIGQRAPLVGAAVGGIACIGALLASGYIRPDELTPLRRVLQTDVWLLRRRGA